MAVSGRRGVLRRSLPFLLFLLLALAAGPQPSAPPAHSAHGSAGAAASSAVQADPVAEPSAIADRPADCVAVHSAQFTAGVRGCRAPPVTSV